MPSGLTLTKPQGRKLMLHTLGLAVPPSRKAGMPELLAAIRRIHQCQIDSISVAARAHLHILFSRVGAFDPALLDRALADGALFEYFAHAMCFLPIEDYPIWRRDMLDRTHIRPRFKAWAAKNAAAIDAMRAHLQQSGPVRSSDFESKEKRGVWWDWKLEKNCLEYFFYVGEVMIRERRSFQRVYDLQERVLPGWDEGKVPSREAATQIKILLAARALGIASPAWLADYFYVNKTPANAAIKALAEEGRLLPAEIEGLHGGFYIAQENLALAQAAAGGNLNARHASLLSMFDPLVHNRQRARELFDFDYTIEVYTPPAQRVYGYYVLPILVGDKLVGRVDLKAWRKEGYLEAVKLHLEPGVRPTAGLLRGLTKALNDYRVWIGLSCTRLSASAPQDLLGPLQSALEALETKNKAN